MSEKPSGEYLIGNLNPGDGDNIDNYLKEINFKGDVDIESLKKEMGDELFETVLLTKKRLNYLTSTGNSNIEFDYSILKTAIIEGKLDLKLFSGDLKMIETIDNNLFGEYSKFSTENRIELKSMPGFQELAYYLYSQNNPVSMKIGNEKLVIFDKKNPTNIPSANLIRGILLSINKITSEGQSYITPADMPYFLAKQEENLNNFVEDNESQKQIGAIFTYQASNFEDQNNAFQNDNFSQYYSNFFDKNIIRDFSRNYQNGINNYKNEIHSPDDLLDKIEEYLVNNPGKKAIFYLALHGTNEGDMYSELGVFNKRHFERILNMSSSGRLIFEGNSCFGGKSFPGLSEYSGNIRLATNESEGYGSRTQIRSSESYNENRLYEIIEGRGFRPTSWISEKGEKVPIS